MSVPIFVVGFQRSGTTLVQGLVGAHPEIAAAPETHYVFRIYDLRDFYGDLTDDDRLRKVVRDLLHPPIPLLDDCGFDDERLLGRIRARGADYATVLDELLLDFAERHGASRWSEKSPGQPLASVVELFPAAKILHVTRDAVDVVGSCVSTTWNDRSVAELAGQWARFEAATRRTAATLCPSHYLPIPYESLVTDPQRWMSRICAFLGVAARPEMSDAWRRRVSVPSFAEGWLGRVGSPIDAASIGRGRAVLSPTQQAAVRAIAAEEPQHAVASGGPSDAVAAGEPSVTAAERYRRTQQFFADLDRRCRA